MKTEVLNKKMDQERIFLTGGGVGGGNQKGRGPYRLGCSPSLMVDKGLVNVQIMYIFENLMKTMESISAPPTKKQIYKMWHTTVECFSRILSPELLVRKTGMAQIRNIVEMKAHGFPGHEGVSVRVKEDGIDSGLQPGPTVDPTC